MPEILEMPGYELDADEMMDAESFRDEVSQAFAMDFKGKVKRGLIPNNGPEYTFLLKINTAIFENNMPLSAIIEECESYQTNLSSKSVNPTSKCLIELIDTLRNPDYRAYLQEDERHFTASAPTPLASNQSHLAANAAPSLTDPKSASPLELELATLETCSIKDETVALMQRYFHRQTSDYVGHFIDLIALNAELNPAKFKDSFQDLLTAQKKKFAEHLDSMIERTMGDRCAIIVRSSEHYFALDFDKKTGNLLILDAAGDFRKFICRDCFLHSKHIKTCLDVTGVESAQHKELGLQSRGHIQKDEERCMLFALSLSREAAAIPELHTTLLESARHDTEKPNLMSVTWFDMPPKLVMLSQSNQLLGDYMRLHESTRSELGKLTQGQTKGFALGQFKAEVEGVIKSELTLYAPMDLDEDESMVDLKTTGRP